MFSNVSRRLGISIALFITGSGAHSSAYSLPFQDPFLNAHGRSYSTIAYDQVIARPPLTQTPVAAVALARINIALYKAKQSAEESLCDGQWTPLGTLVQLQSHAPYETADGIGDSKIFWRFRFLRSPQSLSCGNVSRAQFFQEMSRYLPEWIQIRPAGQLTAFRQGDTTLPGRISAAHGDMTRGY